MATDTTSTKVQTIAVAPVVQVMARQFDSNMHATMMTKTLGVEEVLYHVTLAHSAKCIDCSLPKILGCEWSWGCCCWEEMLAPRSFARVTENAFVYNFPSVRCCPFNCCVRDGVETIYFDKLKPAKLYKAECCTPFHCCCCCALCGEVMVVAPLSCMTNGCCMCLFPCCCYRFFPGLKNAQAVIDVITVAHADFALRKGRLLSVESAVAALRATSISAEDALQAVRALNAKVGSKSKCEIVVNAAGLEAVVNALRLHANVGSATAVLSRGTAAAVAQPACQFLSKLYVHCSVDGADIVSIKARAGAAAAIDAALSALQALGMDAGQGSEEVAQYACSAVANMCSGDADAKRRAGAANGCELTVAALKTHSANARVASAACAALGAICAGIAENKKRAGAAGGVDAVVAALKAHAADADVAERACIAVANVCADSAENKQFAGAAGGIAAVVEALKAHRERENVASRACAALANLCSGDAAHKMLAGEAGGVEAVVAAYNTFVGTAAVTDIARTALGCMVIGNEKNKQRAVAADSAILMKLKLA